MEPYDFWENGVYYPRASPAVHPLTKKPVDSGYEIEWYLYILTALLNLTGSNITLGSLGLTVLTAARIGLYSTSSVRIR